MNATIIAVVLSAPRRDAGVVKASIQSLVAEPEIAAVHVWGALPAEAPTTAVTIHPLQETSYHRGLAANHGNMTRDVLCAASFKRCGADSAERLRWRARLVLDWWQTLSAARRLFPANLLLAVDNDAIVVPGRLGLAVAELAASGSPAASCYLPPRHMQTPRYRGQGTVCFLFTPRARPEAHLLSYHMVQPADWIMSDYSNGAWPVYKVATHGAPGKAHQSTRHLRAA